MAAVATVALGALVVWIVGSLTLRGIGALLVLAGLIALATGTDALVLTLALPLGVAAWLAGHWLYAYRHHEHAGPLGRRTFACLPRRLDPARDRR